MPYIIDRQHALYSREIVAVVSLRQRRIRSRVILNDRSLYHTLTRPRTLMRYTRTQSAAIIEIGSRKARTGGGHGKGALWRKQHT